MKLRWIANHLPGAPSTRAIRFGVQQTQDEANRETESWVRTKIIGEPQCTPRALLEGKRDPGNAGATDAQIAMKFVDWLKEHGYVGLYDEVPE